jgi:hypothetical protein
MHWIMVGFDCGRYEFILSLLYTGSQGLNPKLKSSIPIDAITEISPLRSVPSALLPLGVKAEI